MYVRQLQSADVEIKEEEQVCLEQIGSVEMNGISIDKNNSNHIEEIDHLNQCLIVEQDNR